VSNFEFNYRRHRDMEPEGEEKEDDRLMAMLARFHFREKTYSPLEEIITVSIPGLQIFPLQCKRGREVASPG